MDPDDGVLMKLFMVLPLLAAGLFLNNHLDWVTRNSDYLLPVAAVVGVVVAARIFPDVWRELRGAIPIMLVVGGVVCAVLYMIFGGGADAVVGFSAKDREQQIDAMQ